MLLSPADETKEQNKTDVNSSDSGSISSREELVIAFSTDKGQQLHLNWRPKQYK